MPALSLLAVVALGYMLVSRLDQRWASGVFRPLYRSSPRTKERYGL